LTSHGFGRSPTRPNPGPRSSTAQPPDRVLLEFCRDHEGDVLRFCTDTRIWPTNNISERGLRPTKTQQKISGRLTSEDTTQDRLDIRSYIDTIRMAQSRRPGRHPIRAHRQPLATIDPRANLTDHTLPSSTPRISRSAR
jgi:Transposase IS66 family